MSRRYLAGQMPVAQPRPSARTGPDASFFESVGASFRTTIDEQDIPQADRIADAYKPVVEALGDMGVDYATLHPTRSNDPSALAAGMGSAPATVNMLDPDRVWQAIGVARARDPKAFPTLPATRGEFERDVLTRHGGRSRDQATTARGGFVGQLVGGAGASFADPVNILTLPIGGGKTIAQTIVREAIVNAATEAAQQPTLARNLGRMGEELTAGQAAMNIGAAGLAGGVLGGAGKVVELHGGAAIARVGAAREATLAGIWARLPTPVRDRWTSAAKVTDDDLPELAEMTVGRGNLTEDERAAMAVLVRERQIAQTNPFVRNGAGIAAHREQLSDAIARVLSDAPAPVQPSARGALSFTTALTSGSVPDLPARAALKNRIAVVESAAGSNYANPLSSARGKYQFLQSTWLHYYKQRFGAGGLSDAAILDKRRDSALQDVLIDDMTSDNAAFLRRRGEAETAGNLYLVHFAGQGGARRLFDADPAARAGDILGEGVVRANPWLRDMSARDVIRWASRKMDEVPPARGGARVQLADGVDGERAGIQAELDRLQAERMALVDTPVGDDAPVAADSAQAVAVDAADALPDTPALAVPTEPRAAALDAAPAETLALLPKLREMVADRDRSINRLDRLAADLGVPEADVRRGLLELAKSGAIRMNRKGQFARLPRDIGPVDALKFIGRIGVRDDEGHALVRGRNLQRLVPGAGPLIRKGGKSLDALGEDLWEGGYFGPLNGVERPDQNAVLDLLERVANGEKVYSHYDLADLPEVRDLGVDDGRYDALVDSYRESAQDLDFNVDDALIDHAIRRYGDLGQQEALLRALNDIFDDAQVDARFERDEGYAGYEDADDGPFRDAPGAGTEVGGGRGADTRNAREGGAGRGVDGAEGPLNADSVRAFDDPDAPAAIAQVDSLEHDLRAAIDPAIAERARQETALKAAAPMRAAADQESTIGAPLFDAVDQTNLDLGDGRPVTLGQMFDDIDAEQAAIDTVRKCL